MYKKRFQKNRLILAGVFTFAFSAAFAFLSTANQDETEAASTANFRAGNIISDAVMSDYNSMTVDQIQAFLKSKNACNQSADPASIGASRYENVNVTKHGVTYNRRYYFGSASGLYHVKDGHFVCMADESFNGHSAAYLIWDAAQAFKINPKVLIVLLEKEQGLITDKFPYEVQYRAATGYGCPDTAACDSKYYGLEPQLGNAAYLFRTVLNGGWTNFPLGVNYIQYNPNPACGGSKVNIENRATSALYRYTPYQPNSAALAAGYGVAADGCGAYGNRNFYLLYSDWFGDPHAAPKVAPASSSSTFTLDRTKPMATYQAHIEDYGWENHWSPTTTSSIAGTTGLAKRLEAINIKLLNVDSSSHIYYLSHLADIGWEKEWTSDGKTTGTTGQARRLEAIRIKLDDVLSATYDIYYRSHIEDYGWLAWTKNGEPSGSEGFAKRLEAIEIFLVKKGESLPVSTNQTDARTFIKKQL